ncbi:hypothetical protein Tsubulata_031688 [Turnera subulata]|uniref:Dirigent protein n=1 Tax=Turnera subulata TaxID=218843 RepID=A0A9Q0F8Z3_9ROSI|nr:hypothetical protein Tsubulata_031688 [Turnera subulata]
MARAIFPIFFLFLFALLSCSAIFEVTQADYVETQDAKLHGLKRRKLTHFRVYFHDIYSGPNPTAVAVLRPPISINSSTLFGSISMMDDPLTEGPELSSKLVGRAQGFYASAAQQQAGLLMAMNFVFLQGKYNGSTITILGRNAVFSKVREMPVIGGSGLFRFATGYAQATTYSFNLTTGDAVVEYNVYVLHY